MENCVNERRCCRRVLCNRHATLIPWTHNQGPLAGTAHPRWGTMWLFMLTALWPTSTAETAFSASAAPRELPVDIGGAALAMQQPQHSPVRLPRRTVAANPSAPLIASLRGLSEHAAHR